MVDNRSAGVFGIGGSLNFKSGDISGTAAKTSDDKMGQGTEYFATEQGDSGEDFRQLPYVDRSAQLSATLNSLALMNVAGVLKNNKRPKSLDKDLDKDHKIEDEQEHGEDSSDRESEDELN